MNSYSLLPSLNLLVQVAMSMSMTTTLTSSSYHLKYVWFISQSTHLDSLCFRQILINDSSDSYAYDLNCCSIYKKSSSSAMYACGFHIPAKIKMSFFWKDDFFFFFAKIGIFCKSVAGPLNEMKTHWMDWICVCSVFVSYVAIFLFLISIYKAAYESTYFEWYEFDVNLYAYSL